MEPKILCSISYDKKQIWNNDSKQSREFLRKYFSEISEENIYKENNEH